MDIGILSFNDADNYGATLQEFALYSVLNSLGANAEVIRYRNPYFATFFELSEKNENIIKRILKSSTVNKYQKVKFKKFDDFMSKNMMADKYIEKEMLSTLNDKFDKFIAGSDQIFNLDCSGNDRSYFLDFVTDDNKKYSYAASFGTTNIEKDFDQKKEYLAKFKSLSFRENQATEFVKKQLNIEAQTHIDPSLLLRKEEWPKIGKSKVAGEYILLYLLSEEKNIIEYAEKLAKDKNLPLYYIRNSFIKRINAKYLRDVGPLEWIDLFANAKYIITNSFHGVAFSINFNKQFLFMRKEKNADLNIRIDNLLEVLQLKDRSYVVGKDIDDKIDYFTSNALLEKERETSKKYLLSIIESK